MQRVMENEMEGRAVGLMQSIDYQQVLTGIPADKLDPPSAPLNQSENSLHAANNGGASEPAAGAKGETRQPRKARGRKKT